MKLACLMPVRNEDWVLGLSARAALMWCDAITILLHACTDRSAEIVEEVSAENPGRVVVRTHRHESWTEMAHRQQLLEIARGMEATHIALVDADEVLTGSLIPTIRQTIENFCAPGVFLSLPWLALARDPMRVITGASYWGDRQQASFAFKDQPDYNWSAREGYNHHQRPPLSTAPKKFVCPVPRNQGGLMHLQFLSERRLRAKQALYQMNEVLRHPDNMLGMRATREQVKAAYGRAVYESDPKRPGVETKDVPREWWEPYTFHMAKSPTFTGKDESSEPWQETEVKRLLAEHGREKFAGLDLFGL